MEKDEKKKKPSIWDKILDFLQNAMCYYNASCSIEDGRDPRVDLQELKD